MFCGGRLVTGRAPSCLGGVRGSLGGAPSYLGDAPSSERGGPGVLLGQRGFLLGAWGQELGDRPFLGRERVPELGVCLKLLGSCPKITRT